MDKEKLNQNETPEVADSDFAFVHQDASIHDQKFETKPTTYLKDAFKRFVKNRSSVVAGAILFVLIAMAIIVPVASQNDIDTPNGAASYLPPEVVQRRPRRFPRWHRHRRQCRPRSVRPD